MDALCRVTLLEPYRGDPEAKVPLGNGQRSLIPIGGAVSIGDPSMHVGFMGEDAQNRFKAAQDVVYHLGLGPDGSIIVPVSCAMVHFGDWTIKAGSTEQRTSKRTYHQERARVAGCWGGYKLMPRGKKTQQGVQADTRKIGAPEVPKVRIEVLEQNGHPYGDAYEPWPFYRWEQDIDAEAVREAKLIAMEGGFPLAAQPQAGFDVSSLSPSQLEQLASLLAQKMQGNRRGGSAQT